MKELEFGKTAICGVSGQEIVISAYNYKCPCLNCLNCGNSHAQCQWRYVLETEPCTNDEMRAVVCQNCITKQRQDTR